MTSVQQIASMCADANVVVVACGRHGPARETLAWALATAERDNARLLLCIALGGFHGEQLAAGFGYAPPQDVQREAPALVARVTGRIPAHIPVTVWVQRTGLRRMLRSLRATWPDVVV